MLPNKNTNVKILNVNTVIKARYIGVNMSIKIKLYNICMLI